jgi:hypothetical protein
MLAELVFFQNLLRRSNRQDEIGPSVSMKTTARWLSRLPCPLVLSGGSVIFSTVSLFSIISWTMGDVLGTYLFGESYGNIWMSLGSFLVNGLILSGIMLYLSSSASDGNGWKGGKEQDDGKMHVEWYSRYFQRVMLLLLGSSGTNANLHGMDQQWQGRLLFLQDKMTKISSDTKADCHARMDMVEQRIQQSESRIRDEIASVERGLASLANERHDTNERLVQMIRELLVEASRRPD